MLLVSPPKKVERKRERECVRERGGEREERESGGDIRSPSVNSVNPLLACSSALVFFYEDT